MIDAHMGNSPVGYWELETAIAVLQALEPFNLMFFEEPLHYNNPQGYAELCAATTVPVAGGECLTGLAEWKMYVDMNCFDIGQPDASFSGGLSTVVDIAKIFEDRNRNIATQAWGAGGSLMQNIHTAFVCPNTSFIEVPPDYGPLHSEIIGESFQMENGFVLPPDTVGLGITLTEKT